MDLFNTNPLSVEQRDSFLRDGFLKVEAIISPEEVLYLKEVYEAFLSGQIDDQGLRSDLSGFNNEVGQERIVQIMRPSLLKEDLNQISYRQRALDYARQLLGEDMDFDFDMLIDKPPYSNSPTPWHQDEAYWIDMPDKRAVSCWLALDESVKENGCMWFIPTEDEEGIREHQQLREGGALSCVASEDEGVAIELKPGSCTFHSGRTLHYARGNSTSLRRRAFILNFRPKAMIEYERERGFNHLGNRELKQT